MLCGFIGLRLVVDGETSLGVIGNSALTEAAFDGTEIRSG